MARAPVLALVLALAACSTGPVLAPPTFDVPDLRGTWRGTWAGTPVTLVVLEQGGTAPQGGITVGAWPLTGTPLPSFDGLLTFVSNGKPITVNAQGRFGELDGRLAVVVEALTADRQQLVLSYVSPQVLAGFGTSRLDWDPRGPIDLTRVAAR